LTAWLQETTMGAVREAVRETGPSLEQVGILVGILVGVATLVVSVLAFLT
jgi:hypothetical protein